MVGQLTDAMEGIDGTRQIVGPTSNSMGHIFDLICFKPP